MLNKIKNDASVISTFRSNLIHRLNQDRFLAPFELTLYFLLKLLFTTISCCLISGLSISQTPWTTSGSNIYYNNGRVGIGTIAPYSTLDVKGRGSFGTNPVYVDWTYETNWGGNSSKWAGYIGFNARRNNDDPKDHYYGRNKYTDKAVIEGSNYGFRFLFRNTSSSDSEGQHQLGELLRISDSGNVGIGTTNPEVKLHLSGALALRSGTVSNSSTGDILGINRLVFGDLNAHHVNYGRIWSSGSQLYIQGGLNGISINNTSNVSSIKVLNTGNVGIGNTNPTEKLVVDGKILAEEVKVQNVPASDYVFEPDYNLKPIEEVETFIKENKHLPDIPSAEEFKENGVGLGEMDDMLLRKVEELTLYVIGLQKELMELKNENKEIKSLNIELIDRIEKLNN